MFGQYKKLSVYLFMLAQKPQSKIGIFASESLMNSSFIHADPFGKIIKIALIM